MCTTVPEFLRVTDTGRKISITTCYDYPTARALRETNIDALLVGDSVAMVIHGHQTPLAATPDMLALHIGAVARGAPDKLIIGDMPFPSFRRGINVAMECVDQFVSAGASAVKLEGVAGHEDVIHHIVQSGIPVMGHPRTHPAVRAPIWRIQSTRSKPRRRPTAGRARKTTRRSWLFRNGVGMHSPRSRTGNHRGDLYSNHRDWGWAGRRRSSAGASRPYRTDT